MFPTRSTTSPWRLRLERAADTAVAFATLESVTSVRELLGGEPARHPHQRPPLQPTLRPGRPGVVDIRPQVCTTPSVRSPRSRGGHRATR